MEDLPGGSNQGLSGPLRNDAGLAVGRGGETERESEEEKEEEGGREGNRGWMEGEGEGGRRCMARVGREEDEEHGEVEDEDGVGSPGDSRGCCTPNSWPNLSV